MEYLDEIEASFQEISSLPIDKIPLVGSVYSIPQFEAHVIDRLCTRAMRMLSFLPTLIEISGPMIIVGDLHGNFHDLLRILSTFGSPEKTQYLFLGDYVDRGEYSLETIIYLFKLLLQYPEKVHLIRGNHEMAEINRTYGFRKEVVDAYGSDDLWVKFNEVFNYLPIAAIIDRKVFCVHGGIVSGLTNLNQLYHLSKPITEENIPQFVRGLLWADPSPQVNYYDKGVRGSGEIFGCLAIAQFYQSTGMKMIIRGHESKKNGYDSFSGSCYTVFSTSGYKDKNRAAVMLYKSLTAHKAYRFEPIDYPDRVDAIFYNAKISHKATGSSNQDDATAHQVLSVKSFSKPIYLGYTSSIRNVLNSNRRTAAVPKIRYAMNLLTLAPY